MSMRKVGQQAEAEVVQLTLLAHTFKQVNAVNWDFLIFPKSKTEILERIWVKNFQPYLLVEGV